MGMLRASGQPVERRVRVRVFLCATTRALGVLLGVKRI